ncbi:hypothetical protein [Anaerostipes sp.]|uniref:hypothetical protein n=1 Tax=Anaerostipes sp. TaxID=1872530 RepID=UPI0025C625B3|nr:hypothetical protein [Anaerostipes sp.]MBS7008044.1 hypothetical protein [Anaerostipes sp.]
MKRLYKTNLLFWLAVALYILIIVPFGPSLQKVLAATLISAVFLICHLGMAWNLETQEKKKQKILKDGRNILLLEVIMLIVYFICCCLI